MNKILLLNPPGKSKYLRDQYCSSQAKADYYWPAVDLLVLSGMLKNDFDISVLDAIAQKQSKEQVLDYIKNNSFYAVCALTSSSSRDEDFTLFAKLKKDNELKLILNGGFLRERPREYLEKFDFIDAVITDFTQQGVLYFLKGKTGEFPGICYKNSEKMIIAESKEPSKEFFSYPAPLHQLFPLKKYRMPQARFFPFTCVLSASGCPYDCRFCSSASIPFRKREIKNIIQELKTIKNLGIREVHFPDFTFMADRNHALKLCGSMLSEKLNLSWDCLSRVDCFDSELASIMKKAGCHTIQFGIETQNESLLRSMGKTIDKQAVRKAFSLCRKTGMETIGFFIIGLPQEDEASILKTIQFAKDVDCDYASFSIFVPDFGSRIRGELTKKYPQLKDIYRFDRCGFPVIGNGILSRERIWELKNKAVRDFYFRPQYIYKRIKTLKSISQLKTAFKILSSLIRTQFKVS